MGQIAQTQCKCDLALTEKKEGGYACFEQLGVTPIGRVKVALLGAITYGSDLLPDQPLTQ